MTQTCPLSDEDLVALMKQERARAIGFDSDSENNGALVTERQKALEYFRGQMTDVPSLKNRSSAVTSDAADAVRTLMPDLLDMFTGGDDTISFDPQGEEDEAQAKQETDYLKVVVFQQNDGFFTLSSMIQDALISKVGVVHYYWEDYEAEQELLEGLGPNEAAAVHLRAQQNPAPYVIISQDDGEEPNTFDITIEKPERGKICIKPVPPEDFGVAQDTIRLPDTTYCAMRTRPRAQDLIAAGFDPDLIAELPDYGTPQSDSTLQARDTADEHMFGTSTDMGHDHRQVEIIVHNIRLLNGKKLEYWRVVTGNGEQTLLKKERINRVQFAAITPFPITHRFYGQSVMDLLMTIQQMSTAVLRGYLDSIYFALNQRAEISEAKSSENTIDDFLRNEPGVPVRSKTGDAVKPIEAGGAGFNGLDALEYLATMTERRTGVVRNAQGLNPDTLHETARGALALMSAALRRMRLIGRNFAETGIKDLFLGVHELIRTHSTQAEKKRFGGQWVTVDPSTWGERDEMTIEIGLGSGGKDQQIAMLLQQMEAMQKVIESQGGAQGPVVTWENVYALAKKFFEVTGSKQPEQFVTDPKTAPPQPPQPHPDAVKAQVEGQVQAAKLQLEGQVQAAKLQLEGQKMQQDAAKQQADQQLAGEKLNLEAMDKAHAQSLAATKLQQDYSLAQQDFDTKAALQLATINAQFKTSVTVAQIKAYAEEMRAHVDLTLQASEHDHQLTMQDAEHEAQAAQAEQAAKNEPAPADG